MTIGALKPLGELVPLFGKAVRTAAVAPPPRVAHLSIETLVIDEGYQRALSAASLRLIRRIAERWDWNSYKPLSVAPCGEGRYEVVDGQHTALGAALNGAIETLPCLILSAETRAERAQAFVGINRDRIALTAHALFRARLASGDESAVSVWQAIEAAGVELRALFSVRDAAPAGGVSCIGTLLQIERQHGGDILRRSLAIGAAAEFAPMTSAALKSVSQVLASGTPDRALIDALLLIGPDDFMDRAKHRRYRELAPDLATAGVQVILAEMENREAA